MSRKNATPQPATRPQTGQPSRPTTASTPTYAAMPAANQQTRPAATPSDEDIRRCAYQKWEAAGCPGGDGIGFWLEAEQELKRSPR